MRSESTSTPRRWLAAVAAGVMVIGLGQVPVAEAATNTAITVSNVTLKNVTDEGRTDEGGLRTGQLAQLGFDWDATEANVQPGDSFTLELNSGFAQLRSSGVGDIVVTSDGRDVTIGSCELTNPELVCTFSEEVTRLRNAGFTGFAGDGEASVVITDEVTTEPVTVTVNGIDVDVTLPNPPGADVVPDQGYGPVGFSKRSDGYRVSASGDELSWIIVLGSQLLDDLDAANTPASLTLNDTAPFAATNEDENICLTISEQLGDGQTLAGAQVTLEQGQSALATDLVGRYVPYSRTNITVGADNGRTGTIEVCAKWAKDTNYRLHVTVPLTGAPAGSHYENSASIPGGETVNATQSYVQSMNIRAHAIPGYASLGITKVVEGDEAVADPSRPFTIDGTLTLPVSASNYTDWQIPDGVHLDADGIHGSFRFEVSEAQPVTGLVLPIGTTVNISEVLDADDELPGHDWAAPHYTIDGQQSSSLTIADGDDVMIVVTNTLTPEPSEEPTPGPTPGPSTEPTPSSTPVPSDKPTPAPSAHPSSTPSGQPTPAPSASGSARPGTKPMALPKTGD